MKNSIKLLWILLLINIPSEFTFSQEHDTTMTSIYNMSIEELMNTRVNIATKTDQPLAETPSVVSVITSEEIKKSGARELIDVLQTVPGFDLRRRFTGEIGVGIRGVKGYYTSKLLMMINGIPYNQLFYGNSIQEGYDLNLDAIDRIEIIRGPGSALYGRNAFSGVVNIITKTGKTSDKLLVNGSLGSFNMGSASAYYGFNNKNYNASVAVQRLYTDGTDVRYNDGLSISKWNIFHNNLSLNSTIGIGKFSFSGMYFNLKDGSLNTDSWFGYKKGYYSVSYKDQFLPNLSFNSKIFGYNGSYLEDIELFSPDPANGNPQGTYFRPQVKEYQYGTELELRYKSNPNNELLIGFQANIYGVDDVIVTTNSDANGNPTTRNNQTIIPGWFISNTADSFNSNYANYRNTAFLLQDIWYPFKKLGITIGGRVDFDSQIGGIINPRFGLVYIPANKATIKLLYGHAYRAPAPSEQYQTFGFAVGNKDLKPEKINTFEMAISYRAKKINNSLSFFLNKLTDIIYSPKAISSVDLNNVYSNLGENTSMGLEYENKLLFSEKFSSYFNCSYTFSENHDITLDTTYLQQDIPPFSFNAGVNYNLFKYFQLNMNMFYRSRMEKFIVPVDSINSIPVKDPIGNYAIINSTLSIDDLIKNFRISFSVYNIFNKNYFSQDNEHLYQPSQSRRQFIIKALYYFK